MRQIMGDIVKRDDSTSIIDTLVEKLKGIGGGGGSNPQLAGAGGSVFEYKPTYNLYGSAGKEEVMEADRMNQAEFNKMMKRWQKENGRRKF